MAKGDVPQHRRPGVCGVAERDPVEGDAEGAWPLRLGGFRERLGGEDLREAGEGVAGALDRRAEHPGLGHRLDEPRRQDEEGQHRGDGDAPAEGEVGDQIVAMAERAVSRQDSWAALAGCMDEINIFMAADRGLRDVLFSSSRGAGSAARTRRRLAPHGRADPAGQGRRLPAS
jgi:hypothetical protein